MEKKPFKVVPPQPSEKTKLKMAEFFMKTSVPRILAIEQKEGEKNAKS